MADDCSGTAKLLRATWRRAGRRAAHASAGAIASATVGIVAAAHAQRSAATSATAPVLVFDSVTVIDVASGRLVADQRVVIAGTRIQAVGTVSAVPLPKGAQVVPARGKYLIPGLWDLHVHPKRDAPRAYEFFLANGVTGIRNIGSDVPLDTSRLWRQEILAGRRVGPPRQVLGGPNLESGTGDQGAAYGISDPAQAQHLVDSLKAAGADVIKAREVSRAVYFALAAAARRAGLPIGGHISAVTALEASDSGARLIDHIIYFVSSKTYEHDFHHPLPGPDCWGASADLAACRAAAERFRRNNTWVVPTLYPYAHMAPQSASIATRLEQDIPALLNAVALGTDSQPARNWLQGTVHPDSLGILSLMQRVGMPLVAGTDMVNHEPIFAGFVLHAELAMNVAEGLTPLTALQSATLNPAKMLGATDSLGTVASGKLADLVLLDANPLEDITNTTTIRAVVANGRYFDRTALNRILRGESPSDTLAGAGP